METMKNVFGLKSISTLMIAFVLILASCKKDESALSAADTQNVNSDAVADSYNDEGQDMSSLAINTLMLLSSKEEEWGGAQKAM